jgi:hypothetical protein
VPPSRARADEISQAFRAYYIALAQARSGFSEYLNREKQHHFFVSGAEELGIPDEVE